MPVPVPWQLPAVPPQARWSVVVRDGGTGAVLAEVNLDSLQLTGGLGAIFLLVEVAAQVEAGSLDPDERLPRIAEDDGASAGIWSRMGQQALSVSDLCVLVGACGDGLAINALLRRVGLGAVQARSVALGCTRSALLDRVRRVRTSEHPPTLSVGTAGELSAVMGRLHQGLVVSPAASARVLEWLGGTAGGSVVASALAVDLLAEARSGGSLQLANLTGALATACGEVGLVTGPDATLAYAVLATWPEQVDARDAVLTAMRSVGQQLRAAVGG